MPAAARHSQFCIAAQPPCCCKKQETLSRCATRNILQPRHQGAAQPRGAIPSCSFLIVVHASPLGLHRREGDARGARQRADRASSTRTSSPLSRAHRRAPSAAAASAARADRASARSTAHGRGLIHLRARHPARFPARRARRPRPAIQLNVDATAHEPGRAAARATSRRIVSDEVQTFVERYRGRRPVRRSTRMRVALQPESQPALVRRRHGGHQQVTVLSIVLTGAALIREREHGTIEHCWSCR